MSRGRADCTDLCRFTSTSARPTAAGSRSSRSSRTRRSTVCPKCGGPVRKLISSPAIQFKGSGWYITDYAKKSSTDAGKDRRRQGSAVVGQADSELELVVELDSSRPACRRLVHRHRPRPDRARLRQEAERLTAPLPGSFAGLARPIEDRAAGTRGRAPRGRAASARSAPPPSGIPACCRCRGGRRRPRRHRAAAARAARAGRWSAGSRRCWSRLVVASVSKMSGVRM